MHPDLCRALFSHLQPSDLLAAQAHREVDEHNLAISCIRTEIQFINDQVAKLNERHAYLIGEMYGHIDQNRLLQSLAAPYRRIPNEIISHIFRLTVPTQFSRTPATEWLKIFRAFTQVNNKWRNIAMNDPLLWNFLELIVAEKDWRVALCVLNNWISQTKCTDLCLWIHLPNEGISSTNSDTLYATLNGRTCLSELIIYLEDSIVTTHTNSLARYYFPSLKTFGFHQRENHRRAESIFFDARRINAPILQDLVLDVGWHKPIHRDNLSQISYLYLRLATPIVADYLDVLEHCNALTVCLIQIDPRTHLIEEVDEKHVIELANLETLLIEIHDRAFNLLEYIYAPNLEDFHLIHLPKYMESTPLDAIPFIRQQKKLARIRIEGRKIMEYHNDFIKELPKDIYTEWIDKNEKKPIFFIEE